jgi:hypothetical protein
MLPLFVHLMTVSLFIVACCCANACSLFTVCCDEILFVSPGQWRAACLLAWIERVSAGGGNENDQGESSHDALALNNMGA